jgi:hypothetical protein
MALKGKVLRSVTVLGALLLVVAGCSRDTGGDAAEEKKTVKLGVIAPLTGPLSELGLGIKNSVDLAIRQATRRARYPGTRSSSPPRTTRPTRPPVPTPPTSWHPTRRSAVWSAR